MSLFKAEDEASANLFFIVATTNDATVKAAGEVVAVRDAATLRPVTSIPVVVALFVRIGSTRLLDNRVIHPRDGVAEGIEP